MRLPPFDNAALPYRLVGVSAIECFVGERPGPIVTVETTAGIVELATILDGLTFPGLPGWDGLVAFEGQEVLIRCVDRFRRRDEVDPYAHPLMAFSWDPVRRAFTDPTNLYPLLTEMRSRLGSGSSRASRATRPAPSDIVPLEVEDLTAAEAIVLASRFPIVPTGGLRAVERWEENESMPVTWHRIVLTQVLTGRFAWRGAELMARSGYLDAVLPELAAMNHTDHSKEGHPEGNVWRHSVETLRYRKTTDLVVGLALLLHDSGKPFSHEEGPRKFNHHADIGADVAHAILTRLAFPSALVERVVWLVRYHMIPGALERLPDHRRAPIMSSELFPLLLEVYRCDLSSTYRGPDGYYRACTVYRRFLKRERSRETVGVPARRLRELYVE